MNISVVRVPRPRQPLVRSVVIVLTKEEAVALQRSITSSHHAVVKDKIYDLLTQTFRVEGISDGIYV